MFSGRGGGRAELCRGTLHGNINEIKEAINNL